MGVELVEGSDLICHDGRLFMRTTRGEQRVDVVYRRVDADDIDIFWGAYVGTEDECLVSGRLSEVANEIDAIRKSKQDAKGWIMDSYLLRKRRDRD